jgi:hypothetical protein
MLSCSFKFKPEIDALNDEFTDLGVEVLEPSKGWLAIPQFEKDNGYRPLPGEEHLGGIKQIEERFLQALKKSHFLYICNFEGYLGSSTALEIGSAFAGNLPMFSARPIVIGTDDIGASAEYVASFIQPATPQETVAIMKKRIAK